MCNSQDDVLSEQKMILSQLNEERRALAEERAQFTVSHKLKIEQEQRDSLRSVKVSLDTQVYADGLLTFMALFIPCP